MAAIEKICEYSGDYDGWVMYRWKHAHIQIKPKYRKLFAGAKHTLHVFEKPKRVKDELLGTVYTPCEYSDDKSIFSADSSPTLEYVLEVYDPLLKGNVNGMYLNWISFHGSKTPIVKREGSYLVINNPRMYRWKNNTKLSTVYRKLKRMLKCKKLNIVKHNCSYEEWGE